MTPAALLLLMSVSGGVMGVLMVAAEADMLFNEELAGVSTSGMSWRLSGKGGSILGWEPGGGDEDMTVSIKT